MSSSAGKSAALATYRALLRAGRSYPDYNVRHYILRRSKEAFRSNRAATGEQAAALLGEAEASLALIRRQSTVAGLYAAAEAPSVMETLEKKKQARTS